MDNKEAHVQNSAMTGCMRSKDKNYANVTNQLSLVVEKVSFYQVTSATSMVGYSRMGSPLAPHFLEDTHW